jgi:spore maturation protein CgeB
MNEIWNRTKISYTPMGASVDQQLLSIKSRTFEMGLSGTLMLCQHSPNLEMYYEPNKEFVPFETLEECVDKAKYYLAHENERARIAKSYHDRTRAEHMWQHRFVQLFCDLGLT